MFNIKGSLSIQLLNYVYNPKKCSCEYCFLIGSYDHVVHGMDVSHIKLSSSSSIVQGVVVGKVSPALLTSWHADISHVTCSVDIIACMCSFSCHDSLSSAVSLFILHNLILLSFLLIILVHPHG